MSEPTKKPWGKSKQEGGGGSAVKAEGIDRSAITHGGAGGEIKLTSGGDPSRNDLSLVARLHGVTLG
jgi:hypothetical protein